MQECIPKLGEEPLMTLRVTTDEKGFYEEYRNLLSEQSKIAVSIHDVPDEDRVQIENALQELLAAEVIKQAHDQLRARGVSDEFLDESNLRSSLSGLPLSESDRSILEAKVRLLARRMRQHQQDPRYLQIEGGGYEDGTERPPPKRPPLGTIQQASFAPGHICICMATGVPGTVQSLSGNNPLPAPPPGRNFLTIAVFLTVNTILGPRFSGDTLRLIVEPGAPFGIGPSEMQVGLASTVTWAKEIYAWNLCRGKVASVSQSGPNTTPSFMLLTRGCNGADTIVFTKPQFLGIWADVANFDFTLFWTVFGGRRLTFTWLTD
jgi:hypothetical protein